VINSHSHVAHGFGQGLGKSGKLLRPVGIVVDDCDQFFKAQVSGPTVQS
jgi:hypothetical protein